MASAKQKQAMLAKELAGQPDIADENDNGSGATVTTNVTSGELAAFLKGADEAPGSDELDAARAHELDKEIEAAQRKLRALKLRRAGGYKVKLKAGQKIVMGNDNRTYVADELVGEKGHSVKRVSCIEYEPN